MPPSYRGTKEYIMEIGIKYCGGCNPYHDRKAFVKKIEEEFKTTAQAARPGVHYDQIYVVCGCQVCCANYADLSANHIYLVDHLGMREV